LVCQEKTDAGGRGYWDLAGPQRQPGFPLFAPGSGGWGTAEGGLEAPCPGATRRSRAINPGRTNRRARAGQELFARGTVFILISRSRIYQPYRRNFEITLSGFSFFGVAGEMRPRAGRRSGRIRPQAGKSLDIFAKIYYQYLLSIERA
jgi:hypothetical protein